MRTPQVSHGASSRAGAVRRTVAGVGVVAVLALAGCAQNPAPSPAAPQVTKTVTASPTSTPDASPSSPTGSATTSVPSPTSTVTPTTPAALLSAGATGDRVRELQARLRQIGWYAGAISATYDADTVTGVKGFQTKRAVPSTGVVDAVTWTKLVAMTKTPTSDDMHDILKPGPALMRTGSTGTKVRELQARLKQIGWWSGDVTSTYGSVTTAQVKGFQAKRAIPVTGEVDQRTWDRLVAMTHQPTADELNNVTPRPSPGGGSTAGLDSRCLTGRAMCISKSTRQLVWVVDGKALLRMDVRFGSENNPTREGGFTVYWKNRNHVSTVYGSAMPFAMFFSGGEAVHYSSDFAARGYAGASHGCVNVRNYGGIAWLFDQVRVGDKVIVYW
jgi:peptidoglycan hydrolase-like protein with peptidoglycan-binding domain